MQKPNTYSHERACASRSIPAKVEEAIAVDIWRNQIQLLLWMFRNPVAEFPRREVSSAFAYNGPMVLRMLGLPAVCIEVPGFPGYEIEATADGLDAGNPEQRFLCGPIHDRQRTLWYVIMTVMQHAAFTDRLPVTIHPSWKSRLTTIPEEALLDPEVH